MTLFGWLKMCFKWIIAPQANLPFSFDGDFSFGFWFWASLIQNWFGNYFARWCSKLVLFFWVLLEKFAFDWLSLEAIPVDSIDAVDPIVESLNRLVVVVVPLDYHLEQIVESWFYQHVSFDSSYC